MTTETNNKNDTYYAPCNSNEVKYAGDLPFHWGNKLLKAIEEKLDTELTVSKMRQCGAANEASLEINTTCDNPAALSYIFQAINGASPDLEAIKQTHKDDRWAKSIAGSTTLTPMEIPGQIQKLETLQLPEHS